MWYIFLQQTFEIVRVVRWSLGIFRMSHDFLAIRKTVAELLEHSSAGLHTTRISAALSSHSCLVSFYDVCGFVSKLAATDRR